MKLFIPILAAVLVISCSGGGSPTSPTPPMAATPTPIATPTPTPTTPAPPTPTPTPTPTPGPTVSLSGSWAGTVQASGAATERNTVTYTFDHVGTRLTGTQTGDFVSTLNLTESQVSGSNRTYSGTLVITVGASTATMPGTMAVDTNASTMSGTFSGTNTDGLQESNAFTLRKQ